MTTMNSTAGYVFDDPPIYDEATSPAGWRCPDPRDGSGADEGNPLDGTATIDLEFKMLKEGHYRAETTVYGESVTVDVIDARFKPIDHPMWIVSIDGNPDYANWYDTAVNAMNAACIGW